MSENDRITIESTDQQGPRRAAEAVGGVANSLSPGFCLGIAIGVVAVAYAGSNLLIPMLVTCACIFVATLSARTASKWVVLVFCVQAAQQICNMTILMTIGLDGPQRLVIVDIVAVFAGLVWLRVKPGKLPLYWLTAYQALGSVLAVLNVVQEPWGTAISKVAVARLAVEVLAIIAMYRLHQQMTGLPQAVVIDAS